MADISPSPIGQAVVSFRRFNRFYTRFLGLLDEDLIQSGYSLTEARVLFELATRAGCGANNIAANLGLDAGYLSRILRKFEDAALLARSPMPSDARHDLLRLTKKGQRAFADLNTRSANQAHGILEALSPTIRSTLIRSMREIETALDMTAEPRAPFVLRPHRPGDIGWVIQRHGALYAQEFGWDQTFDALVAKITADFIVNFDPRRERCWIADRDGESLGCIFLVRHPEQQDTAKLRLLLVEPSARGLGLGKALVHECIEFARFAGYKKVTLWTQSILHAAHKIYQQAGFNLVSEEPHHSFGKDLTGQTWELDL
jgi:DNA-binding MarR family transcriptional regulator/GNAT superfamily N-acetyltransferase